MDWEKNETYHPILQVLLERGTLGDILCCFYICILIFCFYINTIKLRTMRFSDFENNYIKLLGKWVLHKTGVTYGGTNKW